MPPPSAKEVFSLPSEAPLRGNKVNFLKKTMTATTTITTTSSSATATTTSATTSATTTADYSRAEVVYLQSTRFPIQLTLMPFLEPHGTAFGGLKEMFRWQIFWPRYLRIYYRIDFNIFQYRPARMSETKQFGTKLSFIYY